MPQPRKTAHLSDSVHQRLNVYALAASVAGVGMLALAKPAEAKIVYTPAQTTFTGPDSYYLDLNHDGITDFTFQFRQTPYQNGSWLLVRPTGKNGVGGFFAWAYRLQTGALIGPKQSFRGSVIAGNTSGRSVEGYWYLGTGSPAQGYLGLKFKIHGKTHYGWARLAVKQTPRVGSSIFTTVLRGYAYETIANKGIIAGKTHGKDVVTVQDATLGHLARGASGLSAWRRKD